MASEHRVDKDTGTAFCCYRLWYRSKMHNLAESINKNKDTVDFAFVFGKSEDETDFQHSAGTGRDYSGARGEALGFTH